MRAIGISSGCGVTTSTVASPHAEGDAPARGRRFVAVSGLLFAASAAATIHECRAMAGGMPMPGGWTMSMAWMRMAGQTWLGAAGMFMGMWFVMMVAMMLPSLVPMLSTYRRSVAGVGGARLDGLTAVVGAGYLFVWTLVGAAAYPIGVAVAAAEMRWSVLARLAPVAMGVVIAAAGCVQLTGWKARHLERCRGAGCGRPPAADGRGAWRHGLRLGRHCALCCSGLMTILLVGGVMDLVVMVAVAGAITIERVAPWPRGAARATGLLAIAAGVLVLVRALGLGT